MLINCGWRRDFVLIWRCCYEECDAAYAIAGGNPAKVIRFRFSERIISKLMSLDYSLVSKEVAGKCLKELYLDITEENVDEVVNTIKKIRGMDREDVKDGFGSVREILGHQE
jgi:hypothetical protein